MRLPHRCKVERQTGVMNELREIEVAWSVISEAMPCVFVPEDSGKFTRGEKGDSWETNREAIFRYSADVKAGDRVTWSGSVFVVNDVAQLGRKALAASLRRIP